MGYGLCIDVYLYERNRCTTKVLWVLKFWEVGGRDFFFFKITAGRAVFNFSCKMSGFLSSWVVFLVNFVIFHAKVKFFRRVGGLLSKKVIFFMQNFIFAGLNALFEQKSTYFLDFLKNVVQATRWRAYLRAIRSDGKRAKRAIRNLRGRGGKFPCFGKSSEISGNLELQISGSFRKFPRCFIYFVKTST